VAAYLGFDAVSTVAKETKDPQRDLPFGILASLVICTIFYVAVSVVFTGLISYPRTLRARREESGRQYKGLTTINLVVAGVLGITAIAYMLLVAVHSWK
jgi:APA family basic amino acid/polyamine antiporter